MSNNTFSDLPEVPKTVNAPSVIARMIDGLVFRFQLATEGLTDNEIGFRPCESSMNTQELSEHIYYLAYTANSSLGGNVEVNKALSSFEEFKGATIDLYQELSQRLKSMSEDQLSTCVIKRKDHELPFWYLLNGHIADALTHIGQITTWRRMAGNPIPKGINVLYGKKM